MWGWGRKCQGVYTHEYSHFSNTGAEKCESPLAFMRLFKLFTDQIPAMKGAFSPPLKLICHTQATFGKSTLCAALIKMKNLHLSLTQICLLSRLRVCRSGVTIPFSWEAGVPLSLTAWLTGASHTWWVGLEGEERERGRRDSLHTISPSACKSHSTRPQAGVMGDIKRAWVTRRTLNLIIQVVLTRGHTYVCARVHA